jgi:hypothetical protein
MSISVGRTIALAALLATMGPASLSAAQSRDIWTGRDGTVHISSVRAAALRYCNTTAANLYPEIENDRPRDALYKACMAGRGQLE